MKKSWKDTLRKWFPLLLTLVGAAAGWLYYYYVGCVTGTCPIASNPIRMTLYGSIMGFVLGVGFRPEYKDDAS